MTMKRSRALLAASAMLALGISAPAGAQILWDNGSSGQDSNWCDNNNGGCGESGWVIYDDFALTGASTVTGLTYDTVLPDGAGSYVSTVYSIWTSDPRSSFASGPAFSDTVAGTTGAFGAGYRITLTGLNISLAAGTYWLGIQNNTNDGNYTTYISSGGQRLGAASQSTNGGTFYNPSIADAAFTIEGTSGAVPEPASWAMMVGGFGLIGGAMRARRKAAVSFV